MVMLLWIQFVFPSLSTIARDMRSHFFSTGRQVLVHITIKYNKNQFLIIKIVRNNNMEIMFKYESS